MVQEKDAHFTREHMTCHLKQISYLKSTDEQAYTKHSEHTHTRPTLKSGTKYTQRDEYNTTAIAS